jgi:hypothetical protein
VCELCCVSAKRSAATEEEEDEGGGAGGPAATAMAPSGLLSLPTPLPGAKFVADSRAGSGRVAAAAKSEDKRALRLERSVADSRPSELGLRSWSKSVVCSLR